VLNLNPQFNSLKQSLNLSSRLIDNCGKLLQIEVMSPSLVEYNFITVLNKIQYTKLCPLQNKKFLHVNFSFCLEKGWQTIIKPKIKVKYKRFWRFKFFYYCDTCRMNIYIPKKYEELVPLVLLDFGISFLLWCVTPFNFFFLHRLFIIDWGGQNLKIRRHHKKMQNKHTNLNNIYNLFDSPSK